MNRSQFVVLYSIINLYLFLMHSFLWFNTCLDRLIRTLTWYDDMTTTVLQSISHKIRSTYVDTKLFVIYSKLSPIDFSRSTIYEFNIVALQYFAILYNWLMSTSYFLYASHSISKRENSFGERNMYIMFQRHQSHITLAAIQDDVKLSIVVVL
jgi:hypothetical protein